MSTKTPARTRKPTKTTRKLAPAAGKPARPVKRTSVPAPKPAGEARPVLKAKVLDKPAGMPAPKPARRTAVTSARRPAAKQERLLMSVPHTLAIDVGGSGIKASVLDEQGSLLAERVRVETPSPCPPAAALEAIDRLVTQLPPFHRISVGFPGVVRGGVVMTAINLGPQTWPGFNLAEALESRFGVPARVINDADMQGFGAIEGRGIEFVMTLGTGVGTAIFWNGRLAPHLEIAHHPLANGKTYEEFIGNAARKEIGNKKWNQRVASVIPTLRHLINFDRLHLGGGNAKKLTIPLDPDSRVVSNQAGITGGVALWKDASAQV
jgi:polyphosphate glucokinase